MHGRIITWVCLFSLIAHAPGVWAQEWLTHKVRRGQNLTVIARQHDVTVQEIRGEIRLLTRTIAAMAEEVE